MHADDPQYYAYIKLNYYQSDLFQQFETIIGVLDQYEKNKYCGDRVDFGWKGEYHFLGKNGNWWEYFFKKLDVGDTAGEFRCISNFEKNDLSFCLYKLSFERAHELIQKYIEVQPTIREKITVYQKAFLDNSFVIGVCYMNNSSSRYSVPKVSYKAIYDMLLVHIVEKDNLKIFVYTNDRRFYSFLKVKHPDIVFEYKKRKHFRTNLDKGEYELINCLLLSQTDLLISTPSRFSYTISQFNPVVPVIELGESLAKKTE